jgi:Protein of unknown function (DUF3500)
MNQLTRRNLFRTTTAAFGLAALGYPNAMTREALASFDAAPSDSLPMQLYKSMTPEQRQRVCLPMGHSRRQYVSNWWYVHPDHRVPSTFSAEQQELIRKIFDSLHSEGYQDAVNKQVLIDQYGDPKNAPAVGFFGTPDDKEFEFVFTGHHVTRRCNAHYDKGMGFGGAPIFYGHYPHPEDNMRENFNETAEHPGNPYWYQGKVFNRFVQALDGKQQKKGLLSSEPRSESPNAVIQKQDTQRGLSCADLSADQKKLFVETMRGMLAMFRNDDVEATIASIEKANIVNRLHVSWFEGKYDIGSDKVWDTWQIEGPDMVWYFRGEPHIHCYFHLKS